MGLAEFFGLLAFFALILFVFFRKRINQQARLRCLARLPPSHQLTFGVVREMEGQVPTASIDNIINEGYDATVGANWEIPKSSIGDLLCEPLTLASIADGALAGIPVFHAFDSIDPAVLHAVEASTADHIHSLPTIHDYIEQHFFHAAQQSADGWLERLSGYVMEQKTAAALEAAGRHVTFAATSNQPLWDLSVDGHHVQVKEGIAGVRSYLAEHHGLAIYTGSETAAAANDPLVHGIHGLGSSTIHAVTHQSLDGIAEGFSPDFHLPVVTLAFSSYREIRLLVTGSTSLLRASCNVAIDGAGVGTGAFAGAKVGAFAGSILGPLGAGIGGFIGAVAGGIGGKMAATGIRHAPFNDAKERFTEASARVEKDMHTAISLSESKVRELQARLNAESVAQRRAIAAEAHWKMREHTARYSSQVRQFVARFGNYMDDLLVAIDYDAARALATIPESGVIRRFFRPTPNDHLRGAINLWSERAKSIVNAEKKRISEFTESYPARAQFEVGALLQKYSFQLKSLDDDLETLVESFYATQRASDTLRQDAVEKATAAGNFLLRKITREVENVHSALVQKLQGFSQTLTPLHERLVVEARAVGIRID